MSLVPWQNPPDRRPGAWQAEAPNALRPIFRSRVVPTMIIIAIIELGDHRKVTRTLYLGKLSTAADGLEISDGLYLDIPDGFLRTQR